jgi:YVTN family beta-propeller protein
MTRLVFARPRLVAVAATAALILVPVILGPADLAGASESRLPHVTIIPLTGNPTGVTFGAGSAWVTMDTTNSVARIDPQRNEVVANIPVGVFPVRAAVGAGGVWVSNCGDNTVTRINPATNLAIGTIKVGVCPFGIDTLGSAVWVVNGDNTIMRIDPASDAVVATIHVPLEACTSFPVCITFRGLGVALGFVWVTTARGEVLRVNPATNRVDRVFHLLSCCIEVGELAFGFGSLWVSIPGGALNTMVYRVDPATGRVLARIHANIPDPFAVAILGNRVWVTYVNGGSTVLVGIDPTLNAPVQRIPVQGYDGTLAAGGGSVWAPRYDAMDVKRITP